MTRKVFDNRQVCHVWAQQTQPEGRAPSIFFDGATIYSYGRHFPMARFVKGRDGSRAVLFTTRSYSVTTERHKGHVRGALYGLGVPVFYAPDVNARPSDIREAYKARIAAAVEMAGKARAKTTRYQWTRDAQDLTREANRYAEFAGQRWRLKLPSITPEALAAIKARLDRAAARDKARRAKIAARRAAERAEDLRAWRAGESDACYGLDCTALRIKGDEIQTSRGARVPVAVAPMVWELVQRVREGGERITMTPAPKLGEFTLDRIEPDGTLYAGCHVIPYSELAIIARQLGYEGAQL